MNQKRPEEYEDNDLTFHQEKGLRGLSVSERRGRRVFVFEKKVLKRTPRFAPERAGLARVAPVER